MVHCPFQGREILIKTSDFILIQIYKWFGSCRVVCDVWTLSLFGLSERCAVSGEWFLPFQKAHILFIYEPPKCRQLLSQGQRVTNQNI